VIFLLLATETSPEQKNFQLAPERVDRAGNNTRGGPVWKKMCGTNPQDQNERPNDRVLAQFLSTTKKRKCKHA